MAGVKLIVIYPRPTDIETFEKLYQEEHVPMAVEKLAGKTKFVSTRVLDSPQGTPPFYRIAEIHFPSMEALQSCAASEGAKEALAHAAAISTGRSTHIFDCRRGDFHLLDRRLKLNGLLTHGSMVCGRADYG